MEAVREQVETEGVNWEQELTRFEESGLSGAAYCRERNLRYSTFGYHKRKKDTVAKPKLVALSPLNARPVGEQKPAGIGIRMDGVGYRITLRSGFDEETLLRALSVMARTH